MGFEVGDGQVEEGFGVEGGGFHFGLYGFCVRLVGWLFGVVFDGVCIRRGIGLLFIPWKKGFV